MSVLLRVRNVLEAEGAVRLAYVFGSCARGEARDNSDVDVGILLDRGVPLGDLGERLERALGRAVDLVDLRRAPPLLLREILRDGAVVVCRDAREQAEFEARALAEYLDTEHLRETQRRYLRERVESRLGPSR